MASRKKNLSLCDIIKNNYSKALFILSFGAAYFLVPHNVFFGWYSLLGIAFMLSFAATFTCLIRNLKEKFFEAKIGSHSLLGAIATVIGFSALQFCTIGLPTCTASLGFTMLSAVLPGFFTGFMVDYAVPILVISVALQAISLYNMNCFLKTR